MTSTTSTILETIAPSEWVRNQGSRNRDPQVFTLKVGYPAASSVTGSVPDPRALQWYMQTIGKSLEHGGVMAEALTGSTFSTEEALVQVTDYHTPGFKWPLCFDVVKVQDAPEP